MQLVKGVVMAGEVRVKGPLSLDHEPTRVVETAFIETVDIRVGFLHDGLGDERQMLSVRG